MSTAIEKAQEALRARREAGESVERMGGGDDHVPRREIRECTAPSCPLYPLRPYQAKGAA